MRRGEVRIADLDPAQPGEASKQRPCIVVSNDGANTAATRLGRGTVSIVPLTSSVAKVYAHFQVAVSDEEVLRTMGLATPSKVQAEQVRTVSVSRIGTRIGWTPVDVLREIDDALRFHLSL